MRRDPVSSQIEEAVAEANRLPPELHAMKAAMDMVFGAVTKPVKNFAPRQLDIEDAIMRAPGFDYNLAWEIFAALQRRLELRYEDRLNPKVADLMKALDRALEAA